MYTFLFLFSVFIASLSQLLLKISSTKTYKSKYYEYLNIYVITAYALFGISTLLTTLAYKKVELNLGPVYEATGYIYILILSYIFLHEKLNKQQYFGMLLILSGICIFTLF